MMILIKRVAFAALLASTAGLGLIASPANATCAGGSMGCGTTTTNPNTTGPINGVPGNNMLGTIVTVGGAGEIRTWGEGQGFVPGVSLPSGATVKNQVFGSSEGSGRIEIDARRAVAPVGCTVDCVRNTVGVNVLGFASGAGGALQMITANTGGGPLMAGAAHQSLAGLNGSAAAGTGTK